MGIVLEVLRYKGFRAEAKLNKGFGKGWEAEYLAKNKGFWGLNDFWETLISQSECIENH